jgi:chromate transporter
MRGPQLRGIMHTLLQQKRQWVSQGNLARHVAGAAVGTAAAFLPSFILMLGLLPIFERVRALTWMRAAMRGIGPAVIGVLAVSLLRLAPHAIPDAFAAVVFAATIFVLLYWRVGAMKAMLAGALLGVVRSRWSSVHALRSIFSAGVGTRF